MKFLKVLPFCLLAAACGDQGSETPENIAMQDNFRGAGLHKGNTIVGSYNPDAFTKDTAREALTGSCLQLNGNGGATGIEVKVLGPKEDFLLRGHLKQGWVRFSVECTDTGVRRRKTVG
jgi:hypothetical protein